MWRHLPILLVLLLLIGVGSFLAFRVVTGQSVEPVAEADNPSAVPVEVAPIESGVIRDVRVLSGSLEARARFTVATKVGGLLEEILVDIGDQVARDQIVARIDDAEFAQAVAQAEAELAVRKAELVRAESDRGLAQRDNDRAVALMERGIASESQLDETSAALEAAKAAVNLAEARVQQAEASLELAKIRLGYTEVKAAWTGGPDAATVSERFQDAGNTVQPGDPVVAVTVLDPLTAVVSVTEGDYSQLTIGQPATLSTDARPGEMFEARVARIAPIFREASRQARIELEVENPQRALRPGMFIRVRIVLREESAETIVPASAIIQRGGRPVVFTVDDSGQTVTMHAVETGIEQAGRVQILNPSLTGRVVTLGQHLLDDGAEISIVEDDDDQARVRSGE